MKFSDTAIENAIITFHDLEDIMEEAGLIRGSHWDWERVTYDFKFEIQKTGEVYYLRVQGVAIEGEIEQADAKVQLKAPILGRHYYPHGVEYDEDFPRIVVSISEERIHHLEKLIKAHQELLEQEN